MVITVDADDTFTKFSLWIKKEKKKKRYVEAARRKWKKEGNRKVKRSPVLHDVQIKRNGHISTIFFFFSSFLLADEIMTGRQV